MHGVGLFKMNLTVNDFDGQNLKDAGPIAVLFRAEWCSFCRGFMPIFESLQEAKVPSATVDLSDFSNPLWETFTIDIVPTVLLFNSGKIIQRYDGVAGQGLNAVIIKEIIPKLKSLQDP